MLTTIVAALLVSFMTYLLIGLYSGRGTRSVADLLPLASGHKASVNNAAEFSASTVATTISLATVVVAFFELAPYFGVWLFWCVLTTILGLWLVRLMAPRIWVKLSSYKTRPSLHQFLGWEYGSNTLSVVGAVCTSLGFLGAFAVELTVGSRFLSGLIQDIPQWVVVAVLSAVAFIYTSWGGFRAVIVTDRIQMGTIWLLLGALTAFIAYMAHQNGSFNENWAKIPDSVKFFTKKEGLISFMVGILVINVLSYLADMSVWQRIGASNDPTTVGEGMGRSVGTATVTWTILVALACLVFIAVEPVKDENPLITLLALAGLKAGLFGKVVLFCAVLGLFGAMLSTASTQLIAVSHTIYEDLFARLRNIPLADRLTSGRELTISRIILIYAALIAMAVVELLAYWGFSVADMVFAVYGAQLALFPPIMLALLLTKDKLKRLSAWAQWAIILGFCMGWGAEIAGKVLESHLAFLSPLVSVFTSAIILAIGYWTRSTDET